MQSAIVNNVRAFAVTGGAYADLPPWVARQRKRQLRRDVDFERRVRLLEDFCFPTASQGAIYTPDNVSLIAWGTYKPRFKVYGLTDLTLKFERHLECDTVSLIALAEDGSKLALLQTDRYVDFHGLGGLYHRTRIPRAGRCLLHNDLTAEVVLGASSTDIYRLSLERGQFLSPWRAEGPAVNAMAQAPWHGLLATGEDGGHVELWDPRQPSRALKLNQHHCHGAHDYADDSDGPNSRRPLGGWRQVDSEAVTALAFLDDGLRLAVGTAEGVVSVWDVRGPRTPLLAREHHHGLPIRRIRYHRASGCLLSADAKSVRIFGTRLDSPPLLTSIESSHSINDFLADDHSGLVIMAVEDPTMQAHFVPALGPAPRWCPFLENVVPDDGNDDEGRAEERDRKDAGTYDNYKFVTVADLNLLGLDHLIGTKLLKAYLHGYFIDVRLYEQARTVANPLAYQEHLQRQRRVKLERERQSRIHAQVGVDDDDDADDNGKQSRRKRRQAERLHHIRQDERFRRVFEDDDYALEASVLQAKDNTRIRKNDSEEEASDGGETDEDQ
jgi:ribosome biogenesis protein ENP2